jgi:hypothetical protein
VSKFESVTQPGASWNAQLGDEKGLALLVAQFVPSVQVPVGVQLAGPGAKEVEKSEGSAGEVTPSKCSVKNVIKQGLGVIVGLGVGVPGGEGNGVGLVHETE